MVSKTRLCRILLKGSNLLSAQLWQGRGGGGLREITVTGPIGPLPVS